MKVYQENIKKYNAETLRLKKVSNRVSFLRLLIFVISITVLIYLFSIKLITPFFIVFPVSILCFGFAIKRHNKIAYLKMHTAFLKSINDSEMLREKCKLEEFDTGQKFIDQNHPYTSDLDIFGQHSIFQLVNRTTTESGMILLSEWLSEPALNDEIHERQKAIKEFIDFYNNDLGLKELFGQSHLMRKFRPSPIRVKLLRKYFSQEWDRNGGPTSIKKILMGHSLKSDVDLSNYNAQSEEA